MDADRHKQAAAVAEFEVATVGCLEVLSIGKGDLRITIGGDEDDTARARALITEMLSKGYAIFVETGKGLTRVKRFRPKAMTYIISDFPEDATLDPAPAAKPGRKREREVAVGGSRAVAVGRTAGG